VNLNLEDKNEDSELKDLGNVDNNNLKRKSENPQENYQKQNNKKKAEPVKAKKVNDDKSQSSINSFFPKSAKK
jgi:hypothetical protein